MAMKVRNSNAVTSSQTRFSAAPMSDLEFSKLVDNPRLLTTLNAGDIVPVYCAEVLPHDTFSIDLDFITRQATLAVPVMGELVQDYYAFFVPNRVVNKSWNNVMGENTSGTWTAPEISLAPLVKPGMYATNNVQVPIGSVADYYGFPTQAPISLDILAQCHDLKFRGYVEIYNRYFRDENYQPPIPYTKLNAYNGFFQNTNTLISLFPGNSSISTSKEADGSYIAGGSFVKEVAGEGGYVGTPQDMPTMRTGFCALNLPLKANKIHDYFTSVLPSPQKGERVAVPIQGFVPLNTTDGVLSVMDNPLQFSNDLFEQGFETPLILKHDNTVATSDLSEVGEFATDQVIQATNLFADLKNAGVSVSVDDLRMSSSVQRVYELMARGGSRYVELINSFFGLDTDNPFNDIPTFLGHFRRDLDLFQTAQTSATPDGDGTPQGNLAAFGYTNKDGKLFTKTFLEHGYIHIFTVIRHKNIYSTMIDRDNFRMSMLDFYQPPLANISEQPVYTRQINPFASNATDGVWGYQEAWSEYRYEPSRCSGYMRNRGAVGTSADDLSVWNYADTMYPSTQVIANGEWLKSNTADVVARSTALSEREAPQFKLLINFHITKERPLPCYSVPGADIF